MELLAGVLVGHDTDHRGPTGCTVALLPPGTVGAVDVRGAAPGTRETDLLDPVNTVAQVDAVVLTGGSAFGLDSVAGVMAWLEEHGRGVVVGPVQVPIVPAAVIFDLLVGDPTVRPGPQSGRRACDAAVTLAQVERGSVGAGAGATVGKLAGPACCMRGGVGVGVVHAGGLTVVALVVVNAVGDVVDPASGRVLAGARTSPGGIGLADGVRTVLAGGTAPPGVPAGASTTIGVVLTDARLDKARARRLAQVGHDGLARTIHPVHTPLDGDTLFAAATGTSPAPADMLLLSVMAAEAVAAAVLDAVREASALRLPGSWVPACRDLPDTTA